MGETVTLELPKSSAWTVAVTGVALIIFFAAVVLGPFTQPQSIEIAFVTVIMLSIGVVILSITARIGFSLMLTGILFLTLSGVAYLKYLYLGNSLLISDLLYMTGASLMKTLKEYPKLWTLALGYIVLINILLLTAWKFAWRPFSVDRKVRHMAAMRLAACLLGALVLGLSLRPQGPFASLFAKTMWTPINENAYLTSFFMSINVMKVELPSVHNTPAENAAWGKLAKSQMRGGGSLRPDIILVLEESTFDPSTLPACDIPQCQGHSLFQSGEYTKSTGPMLSYVFGGGTWLSEFTVLTGMPHPLFGLAGGYAPWLVAPRIRDSLPLQLRRLGYRNIALYPVDGGYMNAREAYSNYGFDALYDATDLGIQPWQSSDDTMFAAAQRVYDRESKKFGQPIFMIVKTVKQHGPHDNHSLESLPAPYDKGLFPKLSSEAQLDLSNYLARLDVSDKAMKELEKYFLKRERPTIVVSFGDHKPSFSGELAKMAITPPPEFTGDPKYITYFKLDTNFDAGDLPHYPVLDIAYIPGLILQAGRLQDDDYFSATQHVRDVCNGMFMYCTNTLTLHGYYAWLFSDDKVYQ